MTKEGFLKKKNIFFRGEREDNQEDMAWLPEEASSN